MTHTLPSRRRFTIADYHRMGESGILPSDGHVELIEGEILDVARIGVRHTAIVEQVAEMLRVAAAQRAIIRIQQPVALGEYSEPEPAVAAVRARDDYDLSGHPRASAIELVIEVAAKSSLRYDFDVKVPLYAKHGIPETWIVDIDERRVTRFYEPRAGVYASIETPPVGALVVSDTSPFLQLDTGVLFADA